jgi:argininosuccinate synthase
MKNKINKVVLAYSGGLDTSVILKWLIEQYKCEVICFAADLGQGEELDPLNEKAIETGASKIYIEDLRLEFVRDYVFPLLRAGAIYQGRYLLGTSIARPLIAKKQIEIAHKEKAEAVSHGATGKGNDQVRFELTYYALDPHVRVIAPWRDWKFKGRKDLIAYARKKGIDVPVTVEKPYSSDRNLLHISFEGGILEDPWREPPENMYQLSVSPENAPDKPIYIEIEYKAGNPIKINGKKRRPDKLLEELNRIGGENGIGREDIVEDRYVGMKSRGIYETPGGSILHVARQALETITLDREVVALREKMMPEYARMVYNGYWFAPERELLQKMFDESVASVTGEVRLKLYKGNVSVVGRRSDLSLYDEDMATFEADDSYNQADAEGFIKLNALRLRLRELSRRKQLKPKKKKKK